MSPERGPNGGGSHDTGIPLLAMANGMHGTGSARPEFFEVPENLIFLDGHGPVVIQYLVQSRDSGWSHSCHVMTGQPPAISSRASASPAFSNAGAFVPSFVLALASILTDGSFISRKEPPRIHDRRHSLLSFLPRPQVPSLSGNWNARSYYGQLAASLFPAKWRPDVKQLLLPRP